MAFCNSCGASLAPGTKFCNNCGTAVAGAPVPAAASPGPGPPAPTGGNSTLKIVLIAVGAIVVIGVLCVATVGLIGYHFGRNVHVRHEGDHVTVDTPFGSVKANNDPALAARDLGVDIYPGAQIQKSGSASASFGNIHTIAANFESSDSLDKVCAFYKAKFPNAMTTRVDQNRCTIVTNDKQNVITINVQPNAAGTKIQIANVSKNVSSSN